MCLKTIDHFNCEHTTLNNPTVASMAEIEKCPSWNGETCPNLHEYGLWGPANSTFRMWAGACEHGFFAWGWLAQDLFM
jgi:hypothetical protein